MSRILFSSSSSRRKAVMHAPVNEINEDYLRLKADYRAKLSDKTLEYLHCKGLVTVAQMHLYRVRSEDRSIVTYENVVIDTNQKFLEFFETV